MKKKILIVIPNLYMRAGGAAKVGSSLSIALAEKYDINIITLLDFKEKYPYQGTYYTLNLKRYNIVNLSKIYQLQKFIKAISPDIILSFMNFVSFWIIPAMYLYNIKIPLILSVNSNPSMQSKRIFYRKSLIRLLYPLKRLTAIVPVSKEIKSIMIKKFHINKSKILPIYNSIDIEKILEMSNQEIEQHKNIFNDPDIFKFISIGRLSPEKGYKYLIEAFYKVIQQFPMSMLIIIGDGILRTEIKRLIEFLKLGKNVILLGYQSNPYKYLSKSDILVLSSLTEGLPYTLIEALIFKIPIISTKCRTGPLEILENGKYGMLTNVADSNDLAEKMILLAQNEDLRKHFSEISHERIKSFDKKKFFQNWSKLIDYCIKNT